MVTVLVLDGVVDAVEPGAFMDLARAEKAVLLEQARQGLPSGPRTTPGGSGFAGAVATAVAWPFACDSLRCGSSAICAALLFVWCALLSGSGRWTEINKLTTVGVVTCLGWANPQDAL